jgi:hypothetical protein
VFPVDGQLFLNGNDGWVKREYSHPIIPVFMIGDVFIKSYLIVKKILESKRKQ